MISYICPDGKFCIWDKPNDHERANDCILRALFQAKIRGETSGERVPTTEDFVRHIATIIEGEGDVLRRAAFIFNEIVFHVHPNQYHRVINDVFKDYINPNASLDESNYRMYSYNWEHLSIYILFWNFKAEYHSDEKRERSNPLHKELDPCYLPQEVYKKWE